MTVSFKKYATNLAAARIVDNTGNATSSFVKNFGPSSVFINVYYGSLTDGATDVGGLQTGGGYPLLPGESIEFPAVKFCIQPPAQDSSTESSIVWVVFK